MNSNEPGIRRKCDKNWLLADQKMVGDDVALVRDLDDVDDEGVAWQWI